MKSRRKFTKEFKQTAVRRLDSGQSVGLRAQRMAVTKTEFAIFRKAA